MKIYTNVNKKYTLKEVLKGDLFAIEPKNELYLKTDMYSQYSRSWVVVSIRTGSTISMHEEMPVKRVTSFTVKFEE